MNSYSSSYKGYTIFSEELKNLPAQNKITINTINQYSFCIAEEDQEFKQALLNSDILLPDGIAIVVAIKATTGKTIKKISGAEIHEHLLYDLNTKNGSCFYLGSSETTLERIKCQLKIDFPNVTCTYYSPPYKTRFSPQENDTMIDTINAFNPDILFIGLSAPKQEKWVFEQKNKLNTPIICSIGAAFDFYAGTIKRPSQLWIDLNLEWLIRLVKEPRRLWRRYLYYGPVFIYTLLKEVSALAQVKLVHADRKTFNKGSHMLPDKVFEL